MTKELAKKLLENKNIYLTKEGRERLILIVEGKKKVADKK